MHVFRLPTFITRQLADKILLIGKSINFIRQSCQDRDPLTNSRSALQNWDVDKGKRWGGGGRGGIWGGGERERARA